MKLVLLVFTIIWGSYLLSPTSLYAERIKGHFKHLPIMKDEALKDGNKRAVKDIEYVMEAENGEYFEVDNTKPPIECLIYKFDRTRQRKPLQTRKDEDLLIDYFHRVKKYADTYYQIVDAMLAGGVEPGQASREFERLRAWYPGVSATYRAMAVTSLLGRDPHKAADWAGKAASINKNDAKAMWLASLTGYASGDKDAAKKYCVEARKLDPKAWEKAWEMEFVKEKESKVYEKWKSYIAKMK